MATRKPSIHTDEQVVRFFNGRAWPGRDQKQLLKLILKWLKDNDDVSSIESLEKDDEAWAAAFTTSMGRQISKAKVIEEISTMRHNCNEFRCFMRVPTVAFNPDKNTVVVQDSYFDGDSYFTRSDGKFEAPLRHYFRVNGFKHYELLYFIFKTKRLGLYGRESIHIYPSSSDDDEQIIDDSDNEAA